MPFQLRPRRLAKAALTVAVLALVAACAKDHPESVFHHRTDFNRDVDWLFRLLMWLGGVVFVFVELLLIWTLVKFRRRPGQAEPKHVHGNTVMEITWTIVPALLLIVIAIPTVHTIFKTQAKARADALQVEVIGHQWWWEFRYPQYGVVTANELYLPIGRTVNFTLHTQDVLHSFWVPALGGKRDLIANHTNYLWFTPDSTQANAYNGACVEYCGDSHGNMRFKAFTVAPADFESWAKHQASPAVGSAPVAPPPLAPATTQVAISRASNSQAGPTVTSSGPPGAGAPAAPAADTTSVAQAGFIAFPRQDIPAYAVPRTPLPTGMTFDEKLLASGNAANGAKLISSGTCIACHAIKGVPTMVGVMGPNLTHVGSRTTIAAGLYPNDAKHLAYWIKNARMMKAGVIMPTLGLNQYDPILKATQKFGLSDQQIADIVAYLQTLK